MRHPSDTIQTFGFIIDFKLPSISILQFCVNNYFEVKILSHKPSHEKTILLVLFTILDTKN